MPCPNAVGDLGDGSAVGAGAGDWWGMAAPVVLAVLAVLAVLLTLRCTRRVVAQLPHPIA